jgi:hypothetical protein
MKNFLKKLMGIDKLEADAIAATKAAEELLLKAKTAEEAMTKAVAESAEAARLAARTPKEIATDNKEPWISVLDTHVNKDNIRNGFFELDWNEFFVLQLRAAGYVGDTDESIVDQWFSELCRNVGAEDGVDMSRRGSGFINVNKLSNGKTEVS